jgi:hypothetical protein
VEHARFEPPDPELPMQTSASEPQPDRDGDSLENARKPLTQNVRKSGIFMLPSEAEAS